MSEFLEQFKMGGSNDADKSGISAEKIMYPFNDFSKKITHNNAFTYRTSQFELQLTYDVKNKEIDFGEKYDELISVFSEIMHEEFRYFPVCLDKYFNIVCIDMHEAAKGHNADEMFAAKCTQGNIAELRELIENGIINTSHLNTVVLCVMEFTQMFSQNDFSDFYKSTSDADFSDEFIGDILDILKSGYINNVISRELKDLFNSSEKKNIADKDMMFTVLLELLMVYQCRQKNSAIITDEAVNEKEKQVLMCFEGKKKKQDVKTETKKSVLSAGGEKTVEKPEKASENKKIPETHEKKSEPDNIYLPVFEKHILKYENLKENKELRKILEDDTAFCEAVIMNMGGWFSALDKAVLKSEKNSVFNIDFSSIVENAKKEPEKMLEALQESVAEKADKSEKAEKASSEKSEPVKKPGIKIPSAVKESSLEISTPDDKHSDENGRITIEFYKENTGHDYKFYEVAFESLMAGNGELKLNLNEKPVMIKRKTIPFIMHEGKIILNPVMFVNGEVTRQQIENGIISRVFETEGFFGESCRLKSIEGAVISPENIILKKGIIYFR